MERTKVTFGGKCLSREFCVSPDDRALGFVWNLQTPAFREQDAQSESICIDLKIVQKKFVETCQDRHLQSRSV